MKKILLLAVIAITLTSCEYKYTVENNYGVKQLAITNDQIYDIGDSVYVNGDKIVSNPSDSADHKVVIVGKP